MTSISNLGFILTFVFLLTCCSYVNGQTGASSVSAALEEKLKNYDKRMAPTLGDSKPIEIGVSMYFMDISSINEQTMDFSVTCYFRQFWKDPRLAGIQVPGWDGSIIQDSDFVDRIWTPDTFFAKSKATIFHESTHPNSLTRISPEGDILRSIRVTNTISCSMDLSYFPMDTQTCSLELESYGHKASTIVYTWRNNGVGIYTTLELTRYKYIGYRKSKTYLALSMGNYSRLGVDFIFKRDMGYYVMNLYLPSALIVALSCLSFWLAPHAMFARGALTITCFLAMVVLLAGSDDALPPVSYVRAIDVYIITCFLLILYAIAHFVVVYHLRPRNSQQYEELEKGANHRNEDQQQLSTFQLDASLVKIMESRASIADKYVKFIFPAVFVLFNFLYWIIYLSIGSVKGSYSVN